MSEHLPASTENTELSGPTDGKLKRWNYPEDKQRAGTTLKVKVDQCLSQSGLMEENQAVKAIQVIPRTG